MLKNVVLLGAVFLDPRFGFLLDEVETIHHLWEVLKKINSRLNSDPIEIDITIPDDSDNEEIDEFERMLMVEGKKRERVTIFVFS